MILVIDIGNSRTAFGIFSEGKLVLSFKRATDSIRSAEELADWLGAHLAESGIDPTSISKTVLSSVVPDAVPSLATAIRRVTGHSLMLADCNTIGLPIRVDNPGGVGTDRLIDTLAAANRYSLPLIVIDLGTATTISVLDNEGYFVGGAIAPGIQTSADSLHRSAAQLPLVDLQDFAADMPVIGPNTAACIQSGIVQGTAAMLDGMIDRIEEQLGQQASRIVTGGFAAALIPFCRRSMHFEPDLLLCGLHDLATRGD